MSALQAEKKAQSVGIDVERPRFSWIIESTARGVEHVSYRLRIDGVWDTVQYAAVDVTRSLRTGTNAPTIAGHLSSLASPLSLGGPLPLIARHRWAATVVGQPAALCG